MSMATAIGDGRAKEVIGRDLLKFGHFLVVGARGHAGADEETTGAKEEDVVSHGLLFSACVPVAPTERLFRYGLSVNWFASSVMNNTVTDSRPRNSGCGPHSKRRASMGFIRAALRAG